MVKIENLPETHKKLWADLARNRAKLEKLLGRKLPPLFHQDDQSVNMETIKADVARWSVQLKKLQAQLDELRKYPKCCLLEPDDKILNHE